MSIGSHIPVNLVGLSKYQTEQIFIKSPMSMTSRTILTPRKIHNDKLLFIHSAYTLNACNRKFHKNIIESLVDDFIYLAQSVSPKYISNGDKVKLYSPGVILHMGKAVGQPVGQAIESYRELIVKMYEFIPTGYKLILETGCGCGSEVLSDPKALLEFYNTLDKSKIGICIDSAHIFGFGVPVNSAILELFDYKISLIHLNDSEVPFGSKKDRHSNLGKGYIWKDKISELSQFIKDCYDNVIPVLAETPSPPW